MMVVAPLSCDCVGVRTAELPLLGNRAAKSIVNKIELVKSVTNVLISVVGLSRYCATCMTILVEGTV